MCNDKIRKLAFSDGNPLISQDKIVRWPSANRADTIALERVVNSGKYHRVNHPIVMNLEDEIKQWTGSIYTRAVGSGTAAIHVCTDYYKKEKEKVIVSALNWPGALSSVFICGMQPIYVDVSLDDGCMLESQVIDELESNPRIILVTHIFGNTAKLASVREKLLYSKTKFIIDDCSQGIAIAKYLNSNKSKQKTDAIAFSGNGAKHLGAGELGLICTSNNDLINHVDYVSLSSSSRNHERIFNPNTLGYNYRPNVFSSSVALSRVNGLNEQLNLRRKNVNKLWEGLSNLKGIKPIFNVNDELNNYYVAPFRIEFEEIGLPEKGEIRDFIVELLNAEGIPVSVWLREPVWEYIAEEKRNIDTSKFPNCKKLLNTMFHITEIAPPNGLDLMELYVQAFGKVWDVVTSQQEWIIEQALGKTS